MKEFYDQIKENLENRPEPVFQEAAWQKMQAKMNQEAKVSKPIPAWVWLAIPMLALLGTNIWSFRKWNQLSDQVERVENTQVKTDTVFITQNHYFSDTVFIRDEPNKVLSDQSYKQSYFQKSPTIITSGATIDFDKFIKRLNSIEQEYISNISNPTDLDLLFPQSSKTSFLGLSMVDSTEKRNREKNIQIEDTAIQLANLDALPHLNLKPVSVKEKSPDLSSFVFQIQEKKSKKNFRKKVYALSKALQPSGFQIGVLGGSVYPYQKDLKNQGGYSIGLQAKLEFSKNLSMWGNTTYMNLIYESSRMDPVLGVPIQQSPDAEYAFESAEVKSPLFQYSIGMQYLFNTDKKLRPLIGVGYGAVSLYPYEVIYEFEKENNVDGDPILTIEREVRQEVLLTDFILLRIGGEYKLSKHFNLNLLGTYRLSNKQHRFTSPNLLSLEGGILYNF